jgi:pyruvate/2-oxoglutarate dehydrogenase complex dihydrolipoamide dehydrogenase (E3) component
MYRRFGSEVTVIERGPRLVFREDEDISAAIREILEKEGIGIHVGAETISFSPDGNDIAVKVRGNGGEASFMGSHLLMAVGRIPNTDDLGLDRAGIAVDKRGFITVDDQLRTNVEGVYAIGDCNGRGAFTHTAYNDYEIVAANLLDHGSRRVSDRILCYALYSDPPLGRIGMTEAQVRASGRPALFGTRPMTRVGRAVEKGESLGFMKILVDAETKQILGASLLGVGCDEAVHSLLDVMYARAPYTTVTNAVHIHPTVSELLPTVLEDLKPLQ